MNDTVKPALETEAVKDLVYAERTMALVKQAGNVLAQASAEIAYPTRIVHPAAQAVRFAQTALHDAEKQVGLLIEAIHLGHHVDKRAQNKLETMIALADSFPAGWGKDVEVWHGPEGVNRTKLRTERLIDTFRNTVADNGPYSETTRDVYNALAPLADGKDTVAHLPKLDLEFSLVGAT